MMLDDAIILLRQSKNFEEYHHSLGQVLNKCSTHKELNKAKAVIDEVKNNLLNTNEEFKAVMKQRTSEARMKMARAQAESNATHRYKMENAKATAKAKAILKILSDAYNPDLEEWVAKTRFKTVDPEELERNINDKLGCPNPKCDDHGKNRRNLMNGIFTCMRCWHKLVPKSKFRDYNRAYWRRFNKKKRNKR